MPPRKEISHMLLERSLQISSIRLIIASFNFIIISYLYFTEFHNYYKEIKFFHLVELHDIDRFFLIRYTIIVEFHELRVKDMIITFAGHAFISFSDRVKESIKEQIRNLIVDAETISCYIGWYKSLQFAKRKKKRIINIVDCL